MNSTPNAKPTESDNVLIVSADEKLVHPYRQIAPAGEQVTKATSNSKATESGDALVERADIGQAQAHEQIFFSVSADEKLVHPYRQIAPAGEKVTKATSNSKATESGDDLVERADI